MATLTRPFQEALVHILPYGTVHIGSFTQASGKNMNGPYARRRQIAPQPLQDRRPGVSDKYIDRQRRHDGVTPYSGYRGAHFSRFYDCARSRRPVDDTDTDRIARYRTEHRDDMAMPPVNTIEVIAIPMMLKKYEIHERDWRLPGVDGREL